MVSKTISLGSNPGGRVLAEFNRGIIMKKLLLVLPLILSGCYIAIADPIVFERNPYDYVLYVEADHNVRWTGSVEGRYVSGIGRRTYQFGHLPACWEVRKISSDGLLRVYVQRRGGYSSSRRYNDQATYRANQTLYGCFR
jgi:hypothetical protein